MAWSRNYGFTWSIVLMGVFLALGPAMANEQTIIGDWRRTSYIFIRGEVGTPRGDRPLATSPPLPKLRTEGFRLGVKEACAGLSFRDGRTVLWGDLVCTASVTSTFSVLIHGQYTELGRECIAVAALNWTTPDSRSSLSGELDVRCEHQSIPNGNYYQVHATVTYEKY